MRSETPSLAHTGDAARVRDLQRLLVQLDDHEHGLQRLDELQDALPLSLLGELADHGLVRILDAWQPTTYALSMAGRRRVTRRRPGTRTC